MFFQLHHLQFQLDGQMKAILSGMMSTSIMVFNLFFEFYFKIQKY